METGGSENKRSLGIPAAIVIAGALIAGAVLFTNTDLPARSGVPDDVFAGRDSIGNVVRAVDERDWIAGDPDAAVTVIEYSDIECPFCARFHPTMERIVAEFPDVRWVYRHFPLTSIHSQARAAALAAECVGIEKGDAAFFAFVKQLFASQQSLGNSLYGQVAKELGVTGDLAACMKEPARVERVDADLAEAIAAGGAGTPFSLVVGPSGRYAPINGALGYEQVKTLVTAARKN